MRPACERRIRAAAGHDVDARLKAARAFWADEEAADDQVQAALLIAQHKKFRAKTVIALDDERKARHLASLPSLPRALSTRRSFQTCCNCVRSKSSSSCRVDEALTSSAG